MAGADDKRGDYASDAAEARRRRLREAGWREARGLFADVPMWTDPRRSVILTEDEAYRRMRQDHKDGKSGGG